MLVIASIIIALQAIVIAYMAWDQSYGCLTRAAFNVMYPILKRLGYSFIALDIDDFKGWNTRLGSHELVNQLVRTAIRHFFSKGRIGDLVFRVYSGDEFIIATKNKSVRDMCNRLMAAFWNVGMTATAWRYEGDLNTAMTKILAQKKNKV